MAKENPKQPPKAAGFKRNIFPLTVLLLASCSPAELTSPSDSYTNIELIFIIENQRIK